MTAWQRGVRPKEPSSGASASQKAEVRRVCLSPSVWGWEELKLMFPHVFTSPNYLKQCRLSVPNDTKTPKRAAVHSLCQSLQSFTFTATVTDRLMSTENTHFSLTLIHLNQPPHSEPSTQYYYFYNQYYGLNIYLCIHKLIYIYMCVCVCVCVYVYTHTHIYAYTYVYVYIYI